MMTGNFEFRHPEDGSHRIHYRGPYRHSPRQGYRIHYRGPYRHSPRQEIGFVARAADLGIGDKSEARKWVASTGRVATLPCKTRWMAAFELLRLTMGEQIVSLEARVEEGWGKNPPFRKDRRMTPEAAAAVYDILIERCLAYTGEKDNFVHNQSDPKGRIPDEWRFGGILGFGGKFWNTPYKWYVSQYPETAGPETRLIEAQTNLALLELFRKMGSKTTPSA